MGEIIRFVLKSECARARLIREARTIYSLFPPADPVSEQQAKASVSGANTHNGNGVLPS
jgi:hypothetical protein